MKSFEGVANDSQFMPARSFNQRLKKLETKAFKPIYACVRIDDIDAISKAKMGSADLELLEQAMAIPPDEFTRAQRTVWNRYEAARREAVNELAPGANCVIMVNSDDSRL